MQKTIKIFYTISFLEACIFTTSVWAFFFTSYLNFSFHTALILTVLSGIVSFLFEIPSWAWADKFGRKKLYLLGLFLIILSFSIWVFAKEIYLFVISAILNWIWFAITSGNLEAIIHDSLEEEKQEDKYKDIQANAYIWIFLGRAFSSVLAWYLFVLSPFFPIYATILSYVLALILIFFVEDKWQKLSEEKSTKIHVQKSVNFIFSNKFIFNFIIILALISSVWNIYWFTYQPYFKQIWISIENIGFLFAITWIFSAIWANLIKKLQDKYTEKQIIFLMIFIIFISWVLFYSFSIIWAILWLILISIMFGFIMSFWNNVLIKKSPKTQKSTILSIFSFAITIWYASFSIASGYIVDYFWLKFLYFWNIILILFLIIFSFLVLNIRKKF